MYTLNVPHCS